jgi:hypothetical protein
VSVADYAEGEFFFDFTTHPECAGHPEKAGNCDKARDGNDLHLGDEHAGGKRPENSCGVLG